MKSISSSLRQGMRAASHSVLYSSMARRMARNIASGPQDGRVRTFIEKHGYGPAFSRLASAPLPDGFSYAKLTVPLEGRRRDQEFQLLRDDEVVFGGVLQAPAKSAVYDARNFIVPGGTPEDYTLSLGGSYQLQLGSGRFSTRQQTEYDQQWPIQEQDSVRFALRGDMDSPSRLIVTFPDFAPTGCTVSYPLQVLTELSDAQLKNTLILAFQDHFLSEGSFLLADNEGNSLGDRVRHIIDGTVSRHFSSHPDTLFYGVGKGGSSALLHSEHFPDAKLLVVRPFLDLPYGTSIPRFQHGLHANAWIRTSKQPGDLFLRYLEEDREIHYFYTDADQHRNASIIEFARGSAHLSKYRMSSPADALQLAASPTVMTFLKEFVRHGMTTMGTALPSDQLLQYDYGDRSGFQAWLPPTLDQIDSNETNSWLVNDLDGTSLYQSLSDHPFDFIKYSAASQYLHEDRHYPVRPHQIAIFSKHIPAGIIPCTATPAFTQRASESERSPKSWRPSRISTTPGAAHIMPIVLSNDTAATAIRYLVGPSVPDPSGTYRVDFIPGDAPLSAASERSLTVSIPDDVEDARPAVAFLRQFVAATSARELTVDLSSIPDGPAWLSELSTVDATRVKFKSLAPAATAD